MALRRPTVLHVRGGRDGAPSCMVAAVEGHALVLVRRGAGRDEAHRGGGALVALLSEIAAALRALQVASAAVAAGGGGPRPTRV